MIRYASRIEPSDSFAAASIYHVDTSVRRGGRFSFFSRKKTDATAGNISVQLEKLSTAGYIEVRKEFVGKRTRTSCRITERGRQAFEEYVEVLRGYLDL